MLDPQLLANAAILLILGLGTVAGRLEASARKQRRLMREMRNRDDALVAYAYRCRQTLHAHGITPPELPKELQDDE